MSTRKEMSNPQPIVILAILQNMWVKDPKRIEAAIARNGEEYRRRLTAYALFAGCLSGKRLRQAFGTEVCERICWAEASREVSGHPSFVPTPDPEHVAAEIAHYSPDIIITFGRIAREAVPNEWIGTIINTIHPAARAADVVDQLRAASIQLNSYLDDSIH